MIALWLATGLLGSAQGEPALAGGGYGYVRPRRKRRLEGTAEAERLIREEAERQAAAELAAFEEEERQRYLRRLDQLVLLNLPPAPDIESIQQTAAHVAAVLFGELEAEFDRLVARMEFERDEEEAIEVLLLAMAA